MKTVNEIDPDFRSDEALEALFAHAAPRPLPRADREAEIREQVQLAWQLGLRRRKHQQYALMALAASAVLVTAIGMFWYQSPPVPGGSAAVAMVDKRFGELHIADQSGVPFYPPEGPFALLPGQTVAPLVDVAARVVVGDSLPPYRIALWHGFSLPLIMSAVALTGGAGIYWLLRHRYEGSIQRP